MPGHLETSIFKMHPIICTLQYYDIHCYVALKGPGVHTARGGGQAGIQPWTFSAPRDAGRAHTGTRCVSPAHSLPLQPGLLLICPRLALPAVDSILDRPGRMP